MKGIPLAAHGAEHPLDETRRTLRDAARKRFGSIPVDAFVEHVIAMTEGADFAVREAALEALQRRWSFAVRDGLAVASRPDGGRVLGPYMTIGRSVKASRRITGGSTRGRRKREPRPYTTLLENVQPIAVSCDCADYLRSSLGLCKHALVVLDDVFASKKRAAAGIRERSPRKPPGLSWDPRLALSGALDRVRGLRFERPTGGARTSAALSKVQAAFPHGAVDHRILGSFERRRELLSLLERSLSPGRGKQPLLGATPAARALVREEHERAERRTKNEANVRELLPLLRSLGRKLYPYQREGIRQFLRSGRLLLADDMGLGKTTQAIAACHALHTGGLVTRGLVIVPSSLKPQWLREWQETTRVPASLVDGRPEERAHAIVPSTPGFSSWVTSNSCATPISSRLCLRKWSCSTRRSASRTTRPSRRPTSRRWHPSIGWC